MNIYKEKDFYKENGSPTEVYRYCAYRLPACENLEFKSDYDQFALVENALYPYIRLVRIKGNIRLPCGPSTSPATDGAFARLTDEERNAICPPIAWGIAAEFVANLEYSDKQQDYVLCKDEKELYLAYYNRYWKYYGANHSGLKYSRIPIEQKETNFISEHLAVEGALWEKSSPLEIYGELYQYALNAKNEYERFVLERKKQLEDIMKPKIKGFSTEIRSTFDTYYVKVFFLDDTVATKAQECVLSLNCVRKVNLTNSISSTHPGTSLTVYPKPMVTAECCEKEIDKALTQFFSNESFGEMHSHNEAKFANIEKHIMDYLDKAVASIDVCVAWFTISELRDKLLQKAKDGVKVRVIIYDDGVNKRNGVDLSGLDHKAYRGERGGFLHDKFCIIDNVHTICGSYNWTRNAEEKNDEDAAFHYEDYKFASEYTRRFNQIWDRDGEEKTC